MENRNLKLNYTEYEMSDGTVVNMSLAMILLYKAKQKNPEVYNSVSKFLTKGGEDIIETAMLLHGAYICANLDEESPIEFKEFLNEMNEDFGYNMEIMSKLVTAKKKPASGIPLSPEQKI